jgi:GT2 family glycosyltransferase
LTLAANTSLLEYLFPGALSEQALRPPRAAGGGFGHRGLMMVRKKALDDVGFFDDRVFLLF